MVGTSTLLRSSGIINLQKRQKEVSQQRKNAIEYKIPEQNVAQPQQVSQGDLEAQRQYEQDLAKYNAAMKDQEDWKLAERLVSQGKEYAAKGDPSVWSKVKKINEYQNRMLEFQAMKAPTEIFIGSPSKPTATDSLGQGMSVATQNTYRDPIYDTQGKFTGQYRDKLIPTPKPASSNVVIKYGENRGSVGGMSIAPELRKDILTPNVKPDVLTQRYIENVSRPTNVNKPTVSSEIRRYQDLGYTSSQANKLAKESVNQGGMTYSPERAKEITKSTTGEKIKEFYIATNPIMWGTQRSVEKVSEYKKGSASNKELKKVEFENERLSRELQGMNQVYGNETTGTINLPNKQYEEYYFKSQEEYQKNLNKYKELGATVDEQGNIKSPTEKRGFFGIGEEYSKSDVYKKSSLPEPIGFITSLPRMLGTEVGGFLSAGAKSIGLKNPEEGGKGGLLGFNVPETKFISTYKDYSGKNIMINGKAVRKEVTVPSQRINILTPKQLQTGGELVPYLNPIGGEIFIGESSLTLGGKILQEGSIKRGVTGYATEYTGEAIGLATLGLLKGGGATKKFFNKEFEVIEKNIPLKSTEPFAYERVSTKYVEGEPKRVSEYVQFVEREPATANIRTTRFRERFPRIFKPLSVNIQPAKFSVLKTIEPTEMISKEPFGVAEIIEGKKYKTIYGIKGQSVLAPVEENVKETKSLIESSKVLRISKPNKKTISIKTPVVKGFEGFLPNLELTQAKTISTTITTPSGKFDITKSLTKFEGNKVPLRTTTFEKVQGVDEEGYKILYHSTTESNLPKIRKEGLRPSEITNNLGGIEKKRYVSLGLTPKEVKGYGAERAMRNRWKGINDKEITLKVKVKEGEYIKGEGKSGIEEYRVLEVPKENIKVVEDKLLDVGLPKMNVKASSIKKVPKVKELPTVSTIQDNLPRMVGGTGKVTSEFIGTGQYEQTQTISARTINVPQQNTFVENKPTQDNILVNRKEMSLQFKTPQIETLKPSLKLDMGLKTNEILKPVEQTKVQERTRLNELVKVAQQMKQEQVMKQQQRLGLKQPQKQSLKLKTIVPKVKTPFKLGNNLLKKISKKAEEGQFEAFAFKFGKQISVAKGTREQVSSELGTFLQKELSASGFLTKGGKKIKAEETGLLGTEFRKSRTKNPYLIVEEKNLRLRKSGTGKIIQMWR